MAAPAASLSRANGLSALRGFGKASNVGARWPMSNRRRTFHWTTLTACVHLGRWRVPAAGRDRSGHRTVDEPTWSTVWTAVSQKRQANPRIAAGRAAFTAARKFKRRPPGEVRDVLAAELTARGITDLTPEQLDLLTEAVRRGPRRTVLSATWSWLVEFRGELRETRKGPLPSWTASPRIAHKLEWGNVRSAVHAIVELAPDDPTIIDRIFDEVPDDTDDGEDGGHRLFPCWVDVGPLDDRAGTVTVHVGKHILGRLRTADSAVVREILAANGYAAVELNAVAVEGDPRLIDVGVPDRV